ncbi:alkaline phosphatase D family protein [Barrientosiimonas humi]|uniref:alkaline phosphatase D family protein n=1 Tax=Barrientosiimonas humi TaxID=999931 RepID=UPI00370D6C05
MPDLVLGPLLRHVGERTASVWVETADFCTVTVRAGERSWSMRTFRVHDHHYALVQVDGLEPGSVQDYTVEIDGEQVWPLADSPYPPSRIATIERDKPTRLAFGSCRTSVPHDAEHTRTHGVDALRATAVHLATHPDSSHWPDMVAFLGDQVYADETSEEMRAYIEQRRGLEEPPGEELKDFEEYAHLYWLAWTDPANRWLLSTLPSVMIFDDHDVRDDWNTSDAWHEEMNATDWWHERLMGALMSYWVYQHVGNLSPEALAEDEVWQQVLEHQGSEVTHELDLTEVLHDLSYEVDRHPERYRFSYAIDLGDARLLMIDSRAARELEPGKRNMLDPSELEWLDENMRGDVEHLLIGTSLPFLLPPGIHDLEAWNEAMAEGAWGERFGRLGEKLRQAVDLEHWAAFEHGFDQMTDFTMSVARGERGRPPATITFLSGDVHNSYVTRIDDPEQYGARSLIVQAVCSPIRNPLPRHVRVLQASLARQLARPMRALAASSEKVPDPPYPWSITDGPWFDNNLAVLQVDGPQLELTWHTGDISAGDPQEPELRTVATVIIDRPGASPGPDPTGLVGAADARAGDGHDQG